MNDRWNTRKSLLLRASNPEDHNAFEEFAHYYTDFIKIVIMKLGVKPEDSKDLLQNILIKLWTGLSKFDSDHERSNFRGWLGTVVRNDVYKFFNKKNREKDNFTSAEDINFEVDEINETEELNEIQQIVEDEWKTYVVTIALRHIEPFFSGNAMEIFSRTLDGLSAGEIAAELDVKENTVYMLRSRVKARFQKEIQNIRELLEFPS